MNKKFLFRSLDELKTNLHISNIYRRSSLRKFKALIFLCLVSDVSLIFLCLVNIFKRLTLLIIHLHGGVCTHADTYRGQKGGILL